MKINIKVMTPEAYLTLQRNYKEVFELIKSHPNDGSWLRDYLGIEPFEPKSYTVDDFELLYDDDYNLHAKENAITLYETFKTLPANVLYDLKFWSWVAFEKAYKQAVQSVELRSAETLSRIWFPKSNGRRELMLGSLSREFIKVKMSVNPESRDPYELTNCLIQNKSLYEQFCYRNISDLETVSHAAIRIDIRLQSDSNNKLHLSEHQCRFLMKVASKLGSVMLIDTLAEKEAYDAMLEKFKDEYPGLLL